MALSSRTAVLTAPRSFSIIDRAVPALAPDHVVVRIAATAVCHTDLGIFKGLYANLKYPVVMGHESTGVIESVGEEVTHVKAGDPVIINPIISCGHCDMCRRERQNLCRNAGLFGRESGDRRIAHKMETRDGATHGRASRTGCQRGTSLG